MRAPSLPARGRDEKASENPYVGPRALRRDNQLFGRDREKRELRSLLRAERIVLLHAPSGAGKTSLIQAGLVPLLEEDFDISTPLRVNAQSAQNSVGNPYLISAMLGLVRQRPGALAVDAEVKFSEWLTSFEEEHKLEQHLLIFDQFEELVTLDPTDRSGQQEFARQVGEALLAPHRWALFSMREDYMGGLSPLLGLIPTRLRVRYRLDFLGQEAAKEAAREPALDRGVDFTDAAAEALVQELGQLRVERPGRQFVTKEASIEPVQLQVVCRTLWDRLAEADGHSFKRIETKDVQDSNGFVEALGEYFAHSVKMAAKKSRVPQAAIRHWFGVRLITAQGYRSQTREAPESDDGDKQKLLQLLESYYLIRADDLRDGVRWYELSHDALVKPVRADNRRWFREKHGPWMEFAWDWREAERNSALLLRGEAFREAKQWLIDNDAEADPLMREFIEASLNAEDHTHFLELESLRQRWAARMTKLILAVCAFALIEAVVIAYLLVR